MRAAGAALLSAMMLLVVLVVPAFASGEAEQPGSAAAVGIANPAAVFCIKSGGTHQIRKAADGSEHGVCVFPDGTQIDAWEFFRTHAPKT